MAKVLALGLDPRAVDPASIPGLDPGLVQAYIDAQLDRVRSSGHDVVSCLVDAGDTAPAILAHTLRANHFDCVLIGAGLRAPEHVRLFEVLLNLVIAQAPRARICFNTNPADSVDAVQRSLG